MRVGIFGGTFSPPHKGHTAAALAFKTQMRLDKLLIIPTLIPPHKYFGGEASCEERLEMCRLAFCDLSDTEISDIEIKRGGKSYTYLTLRELSRSGDELYFLCGTDMILTFDLWKRFEEIFSLAHVCYVRRENNDAKHSEIEEKTRQFSENYSAKISEISVDAIEISSTELRELIKSGLDTSEFLDERVREFIDNRGLYR